MPHNVDPGYSTVQSQSQYKMHTSCTVDRQLGVRQRSVSRDTDHVRGGRLLEFVQFDADSHRPIHSDREASESPHVTPRSCRSRRRRRRAGDRCRFIPLQTVCWRPLPLCRLRCTPTSPS